ncbi:MAG TPA: LLM class F420-dependent oxidoreductase [Candidatus Binatia bacterium]|nr:LLM class F420-dependent oxidoreductase [Candidatus Binatia bacterium]
MNGRHSRSSLAEGFVEFGISLPGRGPLAKPEQVLTMAARADALGYASIFVTDHIVLPASMARSVYPYSTTRQLPGGAAQDYLEPLALLGALARETRRARLGTSVLVIPYRHPLVTAKILATLDRLSGGRMILGAGVGWLREEFEAVGAPPFEERGAVTDEYIALMRRTWTTDPVSFQGRYVTVDSVHALPKPMQPRGIPVWIGGHTDGAVRRAARLGDGWHPLIMRPPGLLLPDEYAARVRQLKAWATEAGRDPGSVTLTVRVAMEVRPRRLKPPAGDRPLFQGTAEEVTKDIRTYADLGVTHFVWDPTHQDLPSVLDNLKRFAHEVAPRFDRGRGRLSHSVGAGGARSGRNVGGLGRGARGSAPAVDRRASKRRRKKSR